MSVDDEPFNIADTADVRALRQRLVLLRDEHRSLDASILDLQSETALDPLNLARLKKRKLQLRDEITWIENHLTPDIIA